MEGILTEAERIFLDRMVPHILAGKRLVDAARAVLEDDERVWLTTMADTDEGAAIREELGKQVYERIRRQ